MRILVTGVSGQVGHDLLRTLAPLGEVVGLDRASMDLGSPDSIRAAVRRVAPALIFNPAAYTAVDRAESEPDEAMRINGIAPGVLGEEAARLGAWLVHYSTDYVFDGGGARPWREEDPTGPLGVYGRTKLAGEQAVAASGCRHLILRTSWVYSLRGRNFLTTMHRLACERDELRVVDDQVGAPTSSAALADAGAALARRLRADPPPGSGLFHMSCAGEVSWCGFARAIVDRLDAVSRALGAPPPARRPRVTPILTEDYPTPAARPRNSVLDNGRLARDFGIALPAWEAALDALLASGSERPAG
ncbi:MAG: dTDP-4-dehydrorhamnose reductase [Gammaproteobacteria bacterium]